LALFCYYSVICHCENGEMTPELRNDLAKIPFADLQDVPSNIHNGPTMCPGIGDYHLLTFIPHFLFGVKMLVRCHSYTIITYLYNLRNSHLLRQIISSRTFKLAVIE